MAAPTFDTIQLAGIIVPAAVAIFVAVLYTRAQTKRDAREQLQATHDAAETQAALIRVQIETAKATAVALKEILGNIEVKVDGRLEKALEKIDRLEGLLATGERVRTPAALQWAYGASAAFVASFLVTGYGPPSPIKQ